MRVIKTLLVLLSASALVGGFVYPSPSFRGRRSWGIMYMSEIREEREDDVKADDTIWLRILQINDVYELENFAHFKTLVDESKKMEKEGDIDKILTVLAGDFLSPSLLSSLDKGRAMIDVMEMCCITHVCLGNHETDVSDAALAERIRQNVNGDSSFCWLNTNMRELDKKLNVTTDPHDVIIVKRNDEKISVGLLGLLTEDPSMYRPGAFGGATIEPVLECTERYLKENKSFVDDVDIIVPLTHQRIEDDRDFADRFTGDTFPIVLGGHDHELYDETHSQCRIVKTGYDVINAAIIDFKWKRINTDDGLTTYLRKPTIDVELVATCDYPANENVRRRIDAHKRILAELEKAKIFRINDWTSNDSKVMTNAAPRFSTANNRLGYSNGSEILCSMLRMAMRAEAGIINAGAIRRNLIYPEDQEWFTWSDLKAEVPFPTEMVVMHIPGQVLEDTIIHSRNGIQQSPPIASGGYLHHCSQINCNRFTFKIESIGGAPFDANKMYLTAFPEACLRGLDNHVPLLQWIAQNDVCTPGEGSGKPAKMAIIELFAALFWLDMGSFDDIDVDGDGVITHSELRERMQHLLGGGTYEDDTWTDLVVNSLMDVADLDRNGTISPIEMMVTRFVATDMLNHVATNEELSIMSQVVREVLGSQSTSISQDDVKRIVNELLHVIDVDGSGTISREEAMNAIGEVKNRCLLL